MKGSKIRPGPFRAVLSLLIALTAVWLAVGSQFWAQTALIASVGILYLFFPPSGYIPRAFCFLASFLLALAAAAFLPAQWFDAPFEKLFQGVGIDLPGTYSPQPWLSWEDLTLLIASLLWAWNCFEIRLSSDHRQFLIGRYLIALGFAAVTTIYSHFKIEWRLPELLQDFGQFANRNQTGDILVMGGIYSLAQAISRITKHRTIGILWVMMTLLFITAIVLNGSRAALVLFALGFILVLVFLPEGRRHRQVAYGLLALVFMVGILIFVGQGTELQNRLSGWLAGDNDWRFAIYQDAASMVRTYPWIGVGLGNFEGVFNTLRVHSALQMSRNLHPESDWWWLAAEMGIGGAVVMAVLIFFAFQSHLRNTPFPEFTKVSLIIAALFLIHSLFDVAGHRMGTVWSCLYLVGMGAFRPRQEKDVHLPKIALRLAGLALVVLTLFRIQSMSVNPLMPTRASVTEVEQAMLQDVPPDQEKAILDRGIKWAPLDWLLYYQRGLLGLRAPEISDETNADFNRALYLDQNSVEVATAIGNACISRDFPEAMEAWRRVMERVDPQRRNDLFEDLNYKKLDEKRRYELSTLAGDDPDLRAIVVIHQDSGDFDWYLQNFFDTNPSLQGVQKRYLKRLMVRWAEVGDVNKFIEEWPLHPEWQDAGWQAYALALAKAGREKDAVTVGLQNLPPPNPPAPPGPQNLNDIESQFKLNPQDSYRGILLYFAQKSAGLDDQALATLQVVAQLPQPPSYIRYLLAKDLLEAGQENAAWKALEPLLNEQ